MASACVPVFFKPIEIEGVRYVDGGLFMNFPVSVIRKECDRVIGINVSPMLTDKYSTSIIGVAERTYHFVFRANTIIEKKLCDILVEVEEAMQFKAFDLAKWTLYKSWLSGYEICPRDAEGKDTVKRLHLPYSLSA